MVGPLRHRQTKEAETDMFNLPPPRHISTLPKAPLNGRIKGALREDNQQPLAPAPPNPAA